MLKVILESPKKYRAKFIDKTIPEKKSEAMDFGTAVHLAFLESQEFGKRYRLEPELRRNTNAYKEWKEQTLAETPDAVLLDSDDYKALLGMVESVMSHQEASAMLKKGIPERSIYQSVELEGGVIVEGKARPDYLHENGDLVDVKTTRDCSFYSFRKQIWDFRYDLSAAYHRHLVNLEIGKSERHFWWLCVEKESPFDVAIYRANEMVLERGEMDWRKAVTRLHKCQTTGVWPGKQEGPQDIDLPAYASYEV